MVYALKETWRVLRPSGTLIDLRPLSIDVPLLILTNAGWKSAGLPDQSQDRVHDNAADRAMRAVVHDGLFSRTKRKYFDVNNFWNSLAALKEDVEERWKEDVIVPKGIWREARLLYKNGSGKQRVRIAFRKKISVYQKMVKTIEPI